MVHGKPGHGWARDTLRRLWPFVESHKYLHESEFTVSGFLNGRALFITALGPKLPNEIQCGWSWTPVCNFIHSHTDDEWQLGRLVDRIKNLGTLRLAATVEIEHLIDVGAKVDDLTAAIRRADQIIQDEIEERTKKGAEASQADAPDLTPQARELGQPVAPAPALTARKNRRGTPKQPVPKTSDQVMADVRARFRDINLLVSNDVLYRLERAEYYIEQFMKGAAALRVKRVEGFQKYDEMVARRMSGVFGYVQLLRSRMIDVDSRMSALSRAYASLKAVKTDKEIEKIQEFGEVALIGFLIPYYLGAALLHYMLHIPEADSAKPWFMIIAFFSLIVIGRSAWRMAKERKILGSAGAVFFAFSVYLLGLWGYLNHHLDWLVALLSNIADLLVGGAHA